MPLASAPSRLDALALGVATSMPVAMLALAPEGPALLRLLLVAALPLGAAYVLYRRVVRGRPPAPRRPALTLPALGPPPEPTRRSLFVVLRRGAPILQGSYDDLLAAARTGQLLPFDVVRGGGVEAAPADFAELLPHVASPWEARTRRLYLGYLGAALAAGAVGLAVVVLARRAGEAEGLLLPILFFALALVPLPFLRREWHRLVSGRARGLVPEPLPRRPAGALETALAGPAPATQRVLVLVVLVSAAALLLPEDALLLRLAKDNDAIRRGEVWRLVTSGLVHGGAFHLLMNAYVLSHLGAFVERLLGARRMLVVLWAGVVTGSIASFLATPGPSVGISGGLFALVGALLAVGLRHRRTLPASARRMLVRAPIEIIVLNVALGLAVPIIDNAAHMGGLAGGILLGLVSRIRPEVGASLRSRAAADEPPGGA